MSNILLMIILIIILFIIVLLYFGVGITLKYGKTGSKLEGCLQIYILRKIKIYSSHFSSKEKKEKNENKNDEDDEEKDRQPLFKLLKPCFRHFKEFLKSFMKCIRVQNLENHLVFGMDSYTDTAKYIGYIWSLMIIVNSSHKNARLSAKPSFNGSIFDVKGSNEFEINLLKLIPPVLKLILQKEVRTLIKGVIDERRN